MVWILPPLAPIFSGWRLTMHPCRQTMVYRNITHIPINHRGPCTLTHVCICKFLFFLLPLLCQHLWQQTWIEFPIPFIIWHIILILIKKAKFKAHWHLLCSIPTYTCTYSPRLFKFAKTHTCVHAIILAVHMFLMYDKKPTFLKNEPSCTKWTTKSQH